MRRRLTWAFLALAAPLALTACDGGSEDQLDATPVTSGTWAPTLPPEAAATIDPEVEAQVVATMSGYFEAANATVRGGSVGDFERLFDPSCNRCSAERDRYAEIQDEGLRAETDRYVDWSLRYEEEGDDEIVVHTSARVAAVDLVDDDGDVADELPAEAEETAVWRIARQDDGRWLIVEGEDES